MYRFEKILLSEIEFHHDGEGFENIFIDHVLLLHMRSKTVEND